MEDWSDLLRLFAQVGEAQDSLIGPCERGLTCSGGLEEPPHGFTKIANTRA